ncbi:hypothetical protein D3C85_953700 [compost metagenome]
MVVRRTIIEVNIPAMITAKTVIMDHNRFNHICCDQCRVIFSNAGHHLIIRMPVTVAAPGIKSSVISGFQHGIINIVICNQVTTPGSFTNIYTSSGYIVNGIMTHLNVHRHRNLHSGYLLLDTPQAIHQGIFYTAVGRKVVCFWPRYPVYFV